MFCRWVGGKHFFSFLFIVFLYAVQFFVFHVSWFYKTEFFLIF